MRCGWYVILAGLGLLLTASDWRQFRGSDLTGIAGDAAFPVRFAADQNIAWKAPLSGRGPSSPIVVGERVFITASGGPRNDHLYVFAFDARTGEKLWRRTLWGTGPVASHPKSSMAAPTPASDGKCVVALFGTNDLACLDMDGRVLWIRALHEEHPGATDGRGLASSPIIIGDVVIVHVENQNVSFAVAIDIKTGVNRWRIDRPREICWTTPIAIPGQTAADNLALLQGMTKLTAVDVRTGREVWSLERTSDPIASSSVAGNLLFVPGDKGLAGYELQPDGKAPKLLWEETKLNPTTASPVVIGDRVYALRQNVLATGDVRTGAVKGQLRLKGPFSASIVAAGGLLYCVNEAGEVHVVKPNDSDGEVLAKNELSATVLATPAAANGALYIRDDGYLVKIADTGN